MRRKINKGNSKPKDVVLWCPNYREVHFPHLVVDDENLEGKGKGIFLTSLPWSGSQLPRSEYMELPGL